MSHRAVVWRFLRICYFCHTLSPKFHHDVAVVIVIAVSIAGVGFVAERVVDLDGVLGVRIARLLCDNLLFLVIGGVTP